jgi:hypothetical protein
MKAITLAVLAFVLLIAETAQARADSSIERGRYLVAFGSCNDCHTPGWRDSDGKIPTSKWMTGSKIGYRGPWGTSYAANARLEFQKISENDWLFMIHTRGGHWPMVWHDLRELTTDDQRAIYRFIKRLGPRGAQTPADLPPSREPSTPYLWVMPQSPRDHS